MLNGNGTAPANAKLLVAALNVCISSSPDTFEIDEMGLYLCGQRVPKDLIPELRKNAGWPELIDNLQLNLGARFAHLDELRNALLELEEAA